MGISREFSFVSFVLSLPAESAREFPGPSRTCLQSQKTANPRDILPTLWIYELRNRVHRFGGWLRYDSSDGAFFMCDGRQNNKRCRVCHK